jgi:hypothetical protein
MIPDPSKVLVNDLRTACNVVMARRRLENSLKYDESESKISQSILF